MRPHFRFFLVNNSFDTFFCVFIPQNKSLFHQIALDMCVIFLISLNGQHWCHAYAYVRGLELWLDIINYCTFDGAIKNTLLHVALFVRILNSPLFGVFTSILKSSIIYVIVWSQLERRRLSCWLYYWWDFHVLIACTSAFWQWYQIGKNVYVMRCGEVQN